MAIEKRPNKPTIDRSAEEAEVMNGSPATPVSPTPVSPAEMGDPDQGGEAMQPSASPPPLVPCVYVVYKAFYPNKSPREDVTIIEGVYNLETRGHLDQVISACMAQELNKDASRLVILNWKPMRA